VSKLARVPLKKEMLHEHPLFTHAIVHPMH